MKINVAYIAFLMIFMLIFSMAIPARAFSIGNRVDLAEHLTMGCLAQGVLESWGWSKTEAFIIIVVGASLWEAASPDPDADDFTFSISGALLWQVVEGLPWLKKGGNND